MNKKAFIFCLLCSSTWAMTELDAENADRNLTSQVTVLTHTPSVTVPMHCQGLIYLGDGVKNLSGASGTFRIETTIGGQTLQPNPQTTYFTSAVRSCIYTLIFPVPANAEVVIKVLSPRSADTDVDVTAYLYDVGTDLTGIALTTDVTTAHTTTDALLTTIDGIVDDILEDTATTIPALITATGPTAHDCDSVTPTTGTVTGGDTHTDTHSDDGSSYQVAPVSPAVNGFGLNQIFVYTIGVGRVPVGISVNGYFNASSPNNDDRAIEVWVNNYTTSSWKQISELGTHMDDESGDQDYSYVLGEGDYQVSDGEVQIRFTSTSTTAADAMYLDHLILSSVAQAAAGLTTDAIEQAVWNHDLEDHEGSTTGAALASSVVYPGIVSTMDSATSFTSSGLPTIADLYNGYVLNIHDISGDIQESKVIIDMDNAGVLTLDSALSFTPAVGDHIHIRTIVSSEHLYEIYTDQKDGGRLDLIWDAIKYKTDLISLVDTVVKDANDANNFTIEDGTDVNDAYWFMAIQVEDADDNLSKEIRWISFYDENSGDPNIWVDEPFSFTPARNDVVHIMGTTYGGLLYQIMRNLAQTRGVLNVVDQSKSGTGGLDRAGAMRIDSRGDDP